MTTSDRPIANARPNVLVFITDQQRADHLGCAGNPVIRTPNLDALAASGVRFERSYVSNPLCQPARATLFTGLTARGHGVRTNGIPLSPGIPTFPEALRRVGYRTHAVGKLHLRNTGDDDEPPETVVDSAALDRFAENRQLWVRGALGALPPNYEGLETVDLCDGHGSGVFGHYLTWLREQRPDGPRLLTREAGQRPPSGAEQSWVMALPAELHYSTWIGDRTIAFLRRHRSNPAEADRPFFLWCSFPDPHHPYCPPRPWAEMYRPDDIELPTRREGELEDLPPHFQTVYDRGLDLSGRRASTRLGDDQLREIIAFTYGMISLVDEQIGRVLAELVRLGLRENTVVVFLSDHGDMMGDHWMLNKGPFHFDGLLRIPMIWSWPGQFPAGVVSDALVSHLDFAPTILDLAGVPIPEGRVPAEPVCPAQVSPWPGQSLRPLLKREPSAGHARLLIENDEDYLGLRLRTLLTDRYQLTAYPGQLYGELFDRDEDPAQLYNLWDHPDYQNLKRDLLLGLLEEIVRTDCALPRRTAHA